MIPVSYTRWISLHNFPGLCCRVTDCSRSRMVQHESALRAYLAAVYPTSRFEGAEVPYSAARSVFRSLELFYNTSTLGPSIELVRPPDFECLDGFYESSLLQRDPAQHYYARLLPCNRKDCFRRQFAAYAPCSTPPWIEVTHLAQWGRKSTVSKLGWRDFFDVGPAMLWFVHTPGSGICGTRQALHSARQGRRPSLLSC